MSKNVNNIIGRLTFGLMGLDMLQNEDVEVRNEGRRFLGSCASLANEHEVGNKILEAEFYKIEGYITDIERFMLNYDDEVIAYKSLQPEFKLAYAEIEECLELVNALKSDYI
jgi:hypothetical protein